MNSVLQNKAIPGVMARALASGLFVSLCTFQSPSGNLIDAGQPDGIYSNVAGLVNIPCMAAPTSIARVLPDQQRSESDVQSFSSQHVLLSGWYPQLDLGFTQGWIAVIDGARYILLPGSMIMGEESDSQNVMTRINVRFGAV